MQNDSITSGQTIKMFLPAGNPYGLKVAEILNWTGKVLSFPRGLLPEVLKTREEVKRTGVYFLIGIDPDNMSRSIVYVGEGDQVSQRLIRHDKDESKLFFEQVTIVVSKDENLTKGHVRYLEARLIAIIRQQGQARLINENGGQPVSLPESDRADMDYFLSQMLCILPALEHGFLQGTPKKKASLQPEPNANNDETIFELSIMNGLITAFAEEIEGQFVLKANSLIRNPDKAAPSCGKPYRQQADDAKQNGLIIPVEGQPEVSQLLQDMAFRSPSGAAEFVTGSSTNGRQYWKVRGSNQTYGDWRAARLSESAISVSL